MFNFIRKLLPPYGNSSTDPTSEQTDEQDRCDHEEYDESRSTSQVPSEIALVDDHLVVVESVDVRFYCRDCGEEDWHRRFTEQGRALVFEPAGAVSPEGTHVTVTEVRDYLARKDLSGVTNDNHPEAEVSIVNESENPDFEPDDGPAHTETVEVGDTDGG